MGGFSSVCPITKTELDSPNVEEPIVGNVKLHSLLFYISAGIAIITIALAGLLVTRHIFCWTRPREQRQIIRIAFFPVVYCILSSASIYSYPDSIYFGAAYGFYEPIGLAALFFLFVEFAEPDARNREFYFNELEHSVITGGRFAKFKKNKTAKIVPGGSLRWYQSKWVALYFYFVATIVVKAVELITRGTGRYCQTSFSPAFAHVWVMIISYIALPIGVLAIVQFYMRMKTEDHFDAHKPTAKILSFKAVIALDFFQQIIFEILIGAKVFKGSATMTTRDFQIAIPALLTCLEQSIAVAWFQWSFSANNYQDDVKLGGREKANIFRAILESLDPTDLVIGCVFAIKLLFKGVGPRGNGSWRRSGGYEQANVKAAVTDVHIENGSSYKTVDGQQIYSNPIQGYEYRGRGLEMDEAQGLAPRSASPSSSSVGGYRSSSPAPYRDGRYGGPQYGDRLNVDESTAYVTEPPRAASPDYRV